MDVEEHPCQRANRFDYRRAERNVRDEMAVHDVQVEPIGPGRAGAGGFFGELAKIRREQRGRNYHAPTLRKTARKVEWGIAGVSLTANLIVVSCMRQPFECCLIN